MFFSGRRAFIRRGIAVLCVALAPTLAFALEIVLTAPGAPSGLKNRLEAASATFATQISGQKTPQELLAAANSDYRTLIQVLYDQGYFGPVINIRLDGREAALIDPLTVPRSVRRIEISVNPGPEFRLGRADMSPVAPGTELPDGYRTGEPANTGILRDAAISGITGWRRVGHAKADVGEQRIVANHQTSVLDADIRLLPGPKLRFGRMTIVGTQAVREDAIEAIAGFPTGEFFDPRLVQKVGARLRRSGAFASVSLKEGEAPNPDGTLDFEAQFIDQLPRQFTFGGEVSSRQGLDLSAVWTHRNLFGAAERLRIEARIRNIGGEEDIDGLLSIRLDRPAELGPDDNVFYLAQLEKLDQPHYTSTGVQVGIGAKRVFSDDLFAEIAFVPSISNANDAFGARRFNLLTLPFRAELDKRDVRVNATAGYFLETKIVPFLGFSGSASGASAFLDGRKYFSLFASNRIVLAGRLQIGSVVGASLSEIAPTLLFYSGGAGTVRGQPYQSLGIPIGTDLAGGRSLLAGSAEIRGAITEKISLVGFFDAGSVGTGAFVDSSSPYQSGAGIGVRYDVGGFGPIRLDLAWPVAGTTGDGLQFYLGIGQAF